MTTYTLLIYRTTAADEPLPSVPPTPGSDPLAGHRAVQAEADLRHQLHAVARLDAPDTARTVRVRASGHEVTDGPFIESKEWLVGFYLVDCDSLKHALARARQICGDPHHVIEVRPVDWRWRG